MRISDTQSSSNDTNIKKDTREKDAAENSSFSKLLAKKRDGGQDANQFQGGTKSRQGEQDPFTLDIMQQQPALDHSMETAPVESKHIVAVPPELQQLVREISVAVNAQGNKEVQIELNSHALKGLNIRIERQAEGVAIQFNSTSDQVSALLQKNLPALTQGLNDRGVTVSTINVSGPKEGARSQDSKGRSNFGNQSGRQGRGR
jgi:flagellar hook-length control protein FliK